MFAWGSVQVFYWWLTRSLLFIFVALLREELVPSFYIIVLTVYFDMIVNEWSLLSVLYLSLTQRSTTRRSPLLRFEGFCRHFYGFPREAVAVRASTR